MGRQNNGGEGMNAGFYNGKYVRMPITGNAA
jgi:hypothetical protein